MLAEIFLFIIFALIALGVLGLILKLSENEAKTSQEIMDDFFKTMNEVPIPSIKKKKKKSFRNRCKAKTFSGLPCKKKAKYGLYCHIHKEFDKKTIEKPKEVWENQQEFADIKSPNICIAATPNGSCGYLAIQKSNYCMHHSEMKSKGLPNQNEYAEMLLMLSRAIKKKATVQFRYWRGTSPGQKRKIIPEDIIQNQNGTILIKGYCLLREAERQFNLTFIRSLTKIRAPIYHNKKEEKINKKTRRKDVHARLEKTEIKRNDDDEIKKELSKTVYDIEFFKYHYNPQKYKFSDRKIDGLTAPDALEVVSGLPFLCFSPITAAIFSWVHRNSKKTKGTYRKEIKNEIEAYLSERISYKYISNFIVQLYGNTNFDVNSSKQKSRKTKTSFKYSKKMLRRIVLVRKGISPQEMTLEFKKSADFKKSLELLETLEKKIGFLGDYKLRTCEKCRLVGIESKWFRTYSRRGNVFYKKLCKICD